METLRFNNYPTIIKVLGISFVGCLLLLLEAGSVHAQWTTNGNNINNTNSGNVGVGTASPNRKLDVAPAAGDGVSIRGTGTDTNTSDVSITNRGISVSTAGFTSPNTFLANFGNPSGQSAGDSAGVLMNISHTLDNNTNSLLTLYNRNQAGATQTGYFLKATGTSASDKFWVNAAGGSFFAGNVGIGSSTPTSKLHLRSGTDSATSFLLLDTGVHGGSSFTVGGTGNNESTFDLSVYRAGTYSSRFGVGSAGQVYLQPSGAAFVGIGTTSPGTMLHVVGDGTVTGNLTVGGNLAAKYQDVAEWVDSSQELAAGTVVVLDNTRANQVVAASQAYDTRVAGVISVKPGLALGEGGEGRVLVATTGRVKVKVDATNGPIQIGDLLVTSEREGFAMKSEPIAVGNRRIHVPGTLIGKALEPLAKGTGEILVLLSLQ
jgi:hypothetical protein